MPKLRPNIWSVPLLLILAMGAGFIVRSNSLWNNFETLNIGRKPRDLNFFVRALELANFSKKITTDEIRNKAKALANGLHRNTLVMGGGANETIDFSVQPIEKISNSAIDAAEKILANPANQKKLLNRGIRFIHEGKIYHVILRHHEINSINWSIAFLTNVTDSIQKEYDQSQHELAIVLLCLAGISVVSTGAIAQGLTKITAALPTRSKIIVPSWWVTQLGDLAIALNQGWEKERNYRLQIEQSTSGHVIVRSPANGEEARMYSPNEAFCKITGYSKEEILGKPLNLIVPSEHHHFHYGDGQYDPVRQRKVGMLAYARGCPFHGATASHIVGSDRTVDLVHKNGSLRQILLGVESSGWSEDESYWQWFGVITDVTELSCAVQSEKALREEFEQLQQSWRHDLLSAVLGTHNMFQTLTNIGFKVEDPKFQELYELAKAKATFAYKLVRDTRDLGIALEDLAKEPMTLGLVLSSIKVLYPEANISYSISDEAKTVFINESSFIGRAISNLINNAIKFSGLNGIIEVGIRTKDNSAIVFIKDNGVGMSEEGQKKIFSGFGTGIRLESNIEGTGLGFYSARKIVEAHGGSICVKSQLGQGSVFFVKIPLTP